MNAYEQIIEATKVIAKERGIFWEEEQAEVAKEMLLRYKIDGDTLVDIHHPL